MSNRTCGQCGVPTNLLRADARFCSAKCRVYFSRRPAFPTTMVSRDRWLRRAVDKRPLTVGGGAGSSTNPATWSSFAVAEASPVGAGLGYVLGDGVGCWDFHHCIVDGELVGWAREALEAIPCPLMVEVSQSGEGVHVFVEAAEGPGRKIRDGRNIEFYSSGRYIAVTGNRLTM